MELKELLDRLNQLGRDIRALEKLCDYDAYENAGYQLGNVAMDKFDAEDLYLSDELCAVLKKLTEAAEAVEYLKRPVKNSGVLRKAPSGYYAFPDGEELHCGACVELLVKDYDHEQYVNDDYVQVAYWKVGRVEHDGEDFYFTASKTTPLDGATARIR